MRTISGSLSSTPVPWLSVLSNIAPASIRRMSASVKAMDKIRQHPNLLVFDDVIAHPEARLPSRSLIWSTVLQPDWSIDEAWKADWLKKEMPNQSLISDPVVCQPDFDLERRLVTSQPFSHWPWPVCLYSSRLGHTRWPTLCLRQQAMLHIVNECSLTKLPGGLQALHSAEEDYISLPLALIQILRARV